MQKQGKRLGLQAMIGTTALQFIVGFLLLFSFDSDIRILYLGDDLLLTSLLVLSLIGTGVLLYFLYLLMVRDKRKYFIWSMASFFLILSLMGWMRHELRETYISPYKEEMPQTTTKLQQEQNEGTILTDEANE